VLQDALTSPGRKLSAYLREWRRARCTRQYGYS
jgi:hypothetical protein